MTAGCPPPRQTGRADFPHPAFAGTFLCDAFTGFCFRACRSHSTSLASRGVFAMSWAGSSRPTNHRSRLFESVRLLPRPLGSTGITPLHRYYGPLRLPGLQPAAYGFAAALASRCAMPVAGISQPAQTHLPCALPPSTPENPAAAGEYLFAADGRLRQIRQIGRSHFA